VFRAGAIALLLLGSGLSPVVLATTPWAAGAGGAVVVPLAPEVPPGQPTAVPTPGDEDTEASPSPDDGAETPDEGGLDEDPEDGSPGDGAEAADPLQVSITRMTPSTLPRRGRVTISGRVTNLSDDEWTDLTVYAATSASPVTTMDELVAAEQSPVGVEPADYQRLVDPDLFVRVSDLGPGESTRYRLRLPRDRLELPTDPGIYRLGVQVLGTENGGREIGADGRARVLVASVAPARRTPLALAVQIRKRTVRTATGQVNNVAGWNRSLGRLGRLREVVRLVGTARDYPVSVVVDPALVEAAGSLAEGNSGFDLTDTTVDGVDEVSGTITDDPPPTAAPGDPEPTGGGSEQVSPTAARHATDAISWLQELRGAVEERDVRAVPYGDTDLGAAARHGGEDLVGRSLAAGISLLSAYDIQATGIAAPHNGVLGQQALEALPDGVPALVAHRSLTAAVVDDGDARVLDTPATEVPAALVGEDGGAIWTYRAIRTQPGTTAGDSALEMRQRILARGALQALTRPGEPLVVALPPQWNPGTQWEDDQFFPGLRTPWLRAVPLADLEPGETPVVGDSTTSDDPDDGDPADGGAEGAGAEATAALALRYPPRQLDVEVPGSVFQVARRLTRTGTVLGDLLEDDSSTMGPRVLRQALLGVSFHARGRVPGAIGRLSATDNVLRSMLRDVEVLAPRFVRMSSASGSFLVPVVNGLDVPVRVRLRPHVMQPGLRLEVPDPVVVGPGARQPIRVEVSAESIGIRSVRVDLVSASGEQLYVGPTFSVRSSQVGRWVWVAMAVGSALLLVAIVVRIYRRVRARRATHGPVLMRGQTRGAP
jgi:hypothetical protein